MKKTLIGIALAVTALFTVSAIVAPAASAAPVQDFCC